MVLTTAAYSTYLTVGYGLLKIQKMVLTTASYIADCCMHFKQCCTHIYYLTVLLKHTLLTVLDSFFYIVANISNSAACFLYMVALIFIVLSAFLTVLHTFLSVLQTFLTVLHTSITVLNSFITVKHIFLTALHTFLSVLNTFL